MDYRRQLRRDKIKAANDAGLFFCKEHPDIPLKYRHMTSGKFYCRGCQRDYTMAGVGKRDGVDLSPECPIHGRVKHYKAHGNGHKCSVCSKVETVKRKLDSKKKLVELLGGKCSSCGYNKYFGAIDLHHVDPTKKELAFGANRTSSWGRLVEEAKKCILLCSNCHREFHAGILDLPDKGTAVGFPVDGWTASG